jgi:hypothetical protein
MGSSRHFPHSPASEGVQLVIHGNGATFSPIFVWYMFKILSDSRFIDSYALQFIMTPRPYFLSFRFLGLTSYGSLMNPSHRFSPAFNLSTDSHWTICECRRSAATLSGPYALTGRCGSIAKRREFSRTQTKPSFQERAGSTGERISSFEFVNV